MRSFTSLALLLCATPLIAQVPGKPPTNFPPDAQTKARIDQQLALLRNEVETIRNNFPQNHRVNRTLPDVAVYLKAAEWITQLNDYPTKDTAKQTLVILAAGLKRTEQLKNDQAPWYRVANKPVVLGYVSEVDGSIQPVVVTIPATRPITRVDVVLHGRDNTLTEVKFLHAAEAGKPKPNYAEDALLVEVFGRGNNAYRWAGESDVYEAIRTGLKALGSDAPRAPNIVLRGFSMGGAGVWHLGLHSPVLYRVLGPGAGFTTTRGYIKNFPERLPSYIERTLTIYDAVNYAENVFNVPVVAYSGEIDPQKAAADNIITALKNFQEPYELKHLVAPGLEHKQPAEWLEKLEAEYRTALTAKPTNRSRFVTYTMKYPISKFATLLGLEEHYKKTVLDVTETEPQSFLVRTVNVRALVIDPPAQRIRIDGTVFTNPNVNESFAAEKVQGTWKIISEAEYLARTFEKRGKTYRQCGPIDDAFATRFQVMPPSPSDDSVAASLTAAHRRFANEWKRYFRGDLPESDGKPNPGSLVVFGTPSTSEAVRKVLAQLPITWNERELIVNGVRYDPANHYPAMIYPRADTHEGYVVLNSGHTFREADLKGTNANLYPRLGDWAVLKIAPTKTDPANAEVVAAGIFDEFWQFEK